MAKGTVAAGEAVHLYGLRNAETADVAFFRTRSNAVERTWSGIHQKLKNSHATVSLSAVVDEKRMVGWRHWIGMEWQL